MHKSRLQELCQRRSWNLPDYQMTKEGPDHNRRYIANITVNGIEFQTPSACRTSKEAQNNVAKLAYEHFLPKPKPPPSSPQTSNSPSLPHSSLPQPSFPQPPFPPTPFSLPQPSAPISSGSSSPAIGVVETLYKRSVAQTEVRDASQAIEIERPITSDKDDKTAENQKNDSNMQRLYKNQLQNYAQKRNLNLPVYSTEREGPPHASRFKCKVTIDGQTFESPQFFSTLKDAEHAAAKVALMSLPVTGAQEDDIGLYKNLLQELVQKEGLRFPVYSTTKSGEAHMPIFLSNVEIEGVVYTGQEAKAKKQAEMSAAKVAYTNLKERKGKLNQCALIQSPAHKAQAPTLSSLCSESTVQDDIQHRANSKPPIGYNPKSVTQYRSKEHKDVGGRDSASSEITTGCVETASSSDVQSSLPRSDNLVTDSGGKPSTALDTSTHRRVTVYSRKTNMEIASGGTLLPISDENWVAYSYPE